MPDLNPQQFRTLYHGTHAKHVDKIRAEGLKTPNAWSKSVGGPRPRNTRNDPL